MLRRLARNLFSKFKTLDRKIQIAVVSAIVVFCCIVPYIGGSQSQSSEDEEPTPVPSEEIVETVIIEITATSVPTDIPSGTPVPTSTPTSFPYVLPQSAECLESLTYIGDAAVSQVIDGDTIEIIMAGGNESVPVRYIGIDSPERDEEYFTESYEYNTGLVQDKQVHLFRDVNKFDPFDRYLYYVVVDDQFVNYEMVKSGWARAVEYPPDTSCAASLYSAEDESIQAKAGFWAALIPLVPTNPPTLPPATLAPTNPPPQPTQPPPQPTQPPPQPTQPPPSGNCHKSYPTVCIPPPPPDLNCGDISFKRFTVLPPDPHNFDGDKNGIGCES